MSFFKGRIVAIATKHQKETAIAPILENELGLQCITPTGIDTDTLGTFTGEVKREDDIIATLRKKCMMAMEVSGLDLAVASEGSFGAHPSSFFAQADDELIMLFDKKNNIEIIERELSLETNFSASEINSVENLLDFAQKVGYPSHGIILKRAKNDFAGIIKENKTLDELVANYHIIKNAANLAFAETDMRAMNNPTRMKVIAKATQRLVQKIKSTCPACSTPGFGVVESQKGLPCEVCGLPTKSTLKHVYRCQKCNYQQEKRYPYDKKTENPQFCDFCNP